MKTLKIIGLTALLTLVPTRCVIPQDTTQTTTKKYSIELKHLTKELEKKGFADVFKEAISDPRFQIYPDLEKHRKQSLLRKVDQGIITFDQYKERVGLEKIILEGKDFMKGNHEELDEAFRKYGVPKEYITAIFGIENAFKGRENTGKLYVFNTLVSKYVLSNETKTRLFWEKEIVAYIEFIKRTNDKVYDYKGSYSAAMGLAQFMPTSLKMFVDSNNDDDDIDLYSIDDNIHSVANYLSENGWKGDPTADSTGAWTAIKQYGGKKSKYYVISINYIAEGLKR